MGKLIEGVFATKATVTLCQGYSSCLRILSYKLTDFFPSTLSSGMHEMLYYSILFDTLVRKCSSSVFDEQQKYYAGLRVQYKTDSKELLLTICVLKWENYFDVTEDEKML